MTTHPDDRTDDRTDTDDRTITVTSMDAGGEQTAHDEPLDQDGEPIFPPQPADAGIPEAEMSDRSLQDTRGDDADLPGDPAGESARLLPDGTGYTAPVEFDAPVADDRWSGADRDRDGDGDLDRDRDNSDFSAPVSDVSVDDTDTDADADADRLDADRLDADADRPDFRDTPDVANVNVAPEPTTADSSSSEPAHLADEDDEAWLALQGQFVDDPPQAVREAGDRVEQLLKDFRSRLESADTEALRNAFKQLRDAGTALR